MKFKPKPLFYVFLFGIAYWITIYTVGFFITVIWTIIIAALLGLFFRLTGRM